MTTSKGSDRPGPPAGAAEDPRLDSLLHWLERRIGVEVEQVAPVAGDAGARRYFRIRGSRAGSAGSWILMDAAGQPAANIAFRHVAALWASVGARVPHIHAADDQLGAMLLEDGGSQTVLQQLQSGGASDGSEVLAAALPPLLRWQAATRESVLPPFDGARVDQELALFRDWYLARHRFRDRMPAALSGAVSRLFDAVRTRFLEQPRVFVHRDFMPRNLLPGEQVGDEPMIIDFQDAVTGPAAYDVVSLYRDAFISHEWTIVEAGLRAYHQQACALGLPVPASADAFFEDALWVATQRHLKVLGIFARLSLRDGKPRYLADEDRFLAYLEASAACSPALDAALRPVLQTLHRASGA